ncbi:MAG TPA: phosphoesterase [Gemmataceae bacterium]|jgi:predicted NUDIX family phosphoesterase
MTADESVLVIPTERFHAAGYFHGFRAANDAFRAAILDPAHFSFRPRSQVETDPAFKQLIPYILLRCGGMLFHYRRGAGGGEKRLAAKRSLGIGGHISTDDAAGPGDPYRNGMHRELHEEIALDTRFSERLLGFINDDSVPVGRVHLGVVHLLELVEPKATAREAAIADAGFAPLTELLPLREEFETWSQFVLDELS